MKKLGISKNKKNTIPIGKVGHETLTPELHDLIELFTKIAIGDVESPASTNKPKEDFYDNYTL